MLIAISNADFLADNDQFKSHDLLNLILMCARDLRGNFL